jgi:hypothetical protein
MSKEVVVIFIARLRILTAVLLVVSLVACGSDDAESVSLGNDPPWGLDTIEMPNDDAVLADVFAAMPDSVAGVQIDEEYSAPTDIAYADGEERFLMIRAISLEEISAFAEGEEFTTQDFISMWVETDNYETLVASQVEEDQPLVYAFGSAMGDDVLQYGTVWAIPNGNWVFVASADTSDALTELVHAFITACDSVG